MGGADPMGGGARWVRVRVVAALCAAAAAALCASPAGAAPSGASPSGASPSGPMRPLAGSGIAGWHLGGSVTEDTVTAGEGVATVAPGGGPGRQIYRGIGTVPAAEKAAGWTHIGDPDAVGGTVIDAFQGRPTAKMFLVTTASGATYRYVHALAPHERYNNSFVAIAPGGQWMVSGTWETVRHLQIYPTPRLNRRTGPRGGSLALSGSVELDRAVHDVQGCDFVHARTLVCSSTGDPALFTNADPLLEVHLAHRLGAGSVGGRVTDLGSIPHTSSCQGTYEPEGVDFDPATGVLRVEIIQPGSCILHTTVFEYKQDRSGSAPG
jgi:hypothetical protein